MGLTVTGEPPFTHPVMPAAIPRIIEVQKNCLRVLLMSSFGFYSVNIKIRSIFPPDNYYGVFVARVVSGSAGKNKRLPPANRTASARMQSISYFTLTLIVAANWL